MDNEDDLFRSIVNRIEDNHYNVIYEQNKINNDLKDKSDENLITDILCAMDEEFTIPGTETKLVNKFLKTSKLTPSERKKLQNLYKLIYGKDGYGE